MLAFGPMVAYCYLLSRDPEVVSLYLSSASITVTSPFSHRYLAVTLPGSNAPLRGGKDSDWEGGVHTPALINGGWLPPDRRGLRMRGIVHIADFYATFCSLAASATATTSTSTSTSSASSTSTSSASSTSATSTSSATASVGACLPDAGPAPLDSVDLSRWLLEGEASSASPRHEIIHDLTSLRKGVAR